MVRVYKPNPRGKRHFRPNEENLKKALDDLKAAASSGEQLSLRSVAKKYAMKKESKGEVRLHMGGQTALSKEEENHIVSCIERASIWGCPIDAFDLRMIIRNYLEERGKTVPKFKNNTPGRDFVYSFLKRHARHLSSRMCQNIKRSRAAVSSVTINNHFDHLEVHLRDVPEENIVNYDETNLSDDPGRKKVLTKRGLKYPERVMNSSKSATSIMYAASASGHVLPVYVVYKAKHLYNTWTTNGPNKACYNRTDSGWFDAACFQDWLEKIALPYFKKKEGKKVLIGDNLSSHLSCQIVKLCEAANVQLIFLPSNSTHLTQPLDIAYFKPLKEAWRKVLTAWKSGPGCKESTVPKDVFPRLLKKLMLTISDNEAANVKSGFRKAGIYPIDRWEVLNRIPAASAIDSSSSSNSSVETQIESNFEKFLSSLRFGDTSTPKRKVKKRLNVAPGKSVQVADFDDCAEEMEVDDPDIVSNENDLPNNNDDNLPNNNDDDLPNNDDDLPNNEDDQPNNDDDLPNNDDDLPNDNDKSNNNNLLDGEHSNDNCDTAKSFIAKDFKIGMFVVIQFTFKTTSKKCPVQSRLYVGTITRIYANKIQVKFARPYQNRTTTFHFIDDERREDDIETVKFESVIRILPSPNMKRGLLYFNSPCY